MENLYDEWILGCTGSCFYLILWGETKGKSLEEIDEIFEGKKHSDVPDLEIIRRGRKIWGISLGLMI